MSFLERAKEITWNVLTLGGGVPRALDGEEFRIDPRVRWLMDPNKETKLRAFLRENVRPDDVLIDVGAHAGFYVLLFCRWAPRGKVIAFEPNPDTREILRQNILLNRIADRVTVEPYAIADREREMDFFALPGEGRSRLGQGFHAGVMRKSKITTTTLDIYFSGGAVSPNWLLIDVEGYEMAALHGARDLLRSRRESMNVLVEMHPEGWTDSGTSRTEAEALLSELGLRAVPVTGQADPLGDYGIVRLVPC